MKVLGQSDEPHILHMDLKNKIESILFIQGEPVPIEKLERVLGVGKDEIVSAVSELKNEYRGRGLAIVEKENEYQMTSAPDAAELVETLIKSELSEDLTRASLETLSVIAYKGPATRSEIEFIRGVNSSFTVRNLLLRGLIERIENPKDARSYLYKISFDFLTHLGLSSIEELPEYAEFRKKADELVRTSSTEEIPKQ
ncbi:MAG: SMC-Scp complex subunit ScpB [Candidatus Sungbacteria bacterium RIFCSPLOWO2_01_FULL_47_10]|uniref:SMC-Scp complex subunit ScpB n=1 Tax=Candidatus Sungbacteria bacterium RIFCSPLOWO2_01_FULL_47_10 TaxID=1802276 RepID=A0A1G2L3R0_9BACT|nr:MAG: SMC-Scp complex subunit ScpB [Candidatus Sungbacteria bacterium RIFCSPLOWO2_01_FULL_47_10]